MTDRPAGFDDIHRLLGKPMRAADASAWPARPHLGGPLPVLPNAVQLKVAHAIARALRSLAAPVELGTYDELVALARRVSGGEQLAQKQLQDASKHSKKDSPAIKIAKSTARAALGYLYAAPSARNSVGLNIENAAIAGVRSLDHVEAVRAFLETIDQAIMCEELRAALAERALAPSTEIAQIVSRPRGGTKSLALVMARLVDGTYGLFVKLRSRWEWHEGDRATMFATVPDAFMRVVAADLDPDFTRSRA